MNFTKEELIDRLRISKTDLDTELIEQPSLFNEVSDNCVNSIDERDYLKEQLAQVEARLSRETRLEMDRNKEKYVAAQITQAVQEEAEYINLFEELLEAKKQCNSWQVLKDSYEQRSRMLGHLCRLYISDYYATPTASDKSTSDNVKQKITRRHLSVARKSRDRSN